MKVRLISAEQPLALSRGEQESRLMQGLRNELLWPPATGNRGDQKKGEGRGGRKLLFFLALSEYRFASKGVTVLKV